LQTIDRTQYIGSSDIASVMAVSRWKTPLKLWAEKTGKIQRSESGEAAEWGNRLESIVAEKFAEKNGLKLMAYKKRFVHEEYPFLTCELDRIVVGTDEIVEVKTCSAWLFKEWEADEVPLEYILQVNFALGLSGRKTGYFAVLIGGQKYLEKKIKFDQELFDKQVEAAVNFWNQFIITNIPPQAISQDNEETLQQLFPASVPNKLTFEGEDNDLVNGLLLDRAGAIEAIKHAEEEIDKIEAEIKQRIGENETAETDQYKIQWKTQQRSSVDTVRLREAGLYEIYAKTTSCRPFSAKDKNKKEKK